MDMKQYRKDIITQNMRYIEYGPLKTIPINKSIKNKYNENFSISETDIFCDVYILKDISSITVAESYAGKYRTTIVNMITEDFDGGAIASSRGFIDETINVRTNLYKSIANIFPFKKGDVAYSQDVTVIRNSKYLINVKDFFKINIVTTLIHNVENNHVTLDDYVLIKEIVEAIFQTAIISKNDVLILSDFGCVNNGMLTKDVVDIYNLCILKYGYHFKNIIILFDIKNKDMMAHYYYFLKNIIIPQDLVEKNIIDNEEHHNETFESQLNKLQTY